jgi:hypothetical protein
VVALAPRIAALLFALTVGLTHADWRVWAPNGETQFTGQAIDVETGQPIPGISVIATYVLTSGGMHHGPGCTVAEYVKSDERGEYRLPFYEGRPPQHLNAFGHRYLQPKHDPRQVTTDGKGGWIVNYWKVEKGRVLEQTRREGPFRTEELAGKASRLLQDVWLEKFEGSDEEWLRKIKFIANNAGAGCPSGKTGGVVDWTEALLREAESMPDSSTKQEVVQHRRESLQYERSFASKTTRQYLPKR